jgi:hypothetical protein
LLRQPKDLLDVLSKLIPKLVDQIVVYKGKTAGAVRAYYTCAVCEVICKHNLHPVSRAWSSTLTRTHRHGKFTLSDEEMFGLAVAMRDISLVRQLLQDRR